jgi:hypothetical protein
MHVSLYQHHVHVLIQVKNNDRRGVDRFGRDGVGLTDLAMSMSSMWPRRVAGLQQRASVVAELKITPLASGRWRSVIFSTLQSVP